MMDLRRQPPADGVGPGPSLVRTEWDELELGKRLAPYDPVAVSSMLTGLNVGPSDLDVVCDLRPGGFLQAVRAWYGDRPGFATWRSGPRTVVTFDGPHLRVELVGEERAVEEQTAYLHAVAHRRLTDLGGAAFIRAVRHARLEHGLKTEPAIAAVLGLAGEPYAGVMRLAAATEGDLVALLRRARIVSG
jgi:Domain of unknown function (DUF4269)